MNKVLKSIILFVIILSCINTSVIAEDGLNTNNEEYLVSETFGALTFINSNVNT